MSSPIKVGSRPPKAIGTKRPATSYRDRFAVRVVVQNAAGEVAIIHIKEGNFYKLPGGSVELDEDHMEAAHREVLEETGATISIHSDCFATTEEYRMDLHQISYCYCADLVDDSGKPELTEEELVDGFSHSWMPFNKALEAIKAAEPTSELGQYIRKRDIYLLEESQGIFNTNTK